MGAASEGATIASAVPQPHAHRPPLACLAMYSSLTSCPSSPLKGRRPVSSWYDTMPSDQMSADSVYFMRRTCKERGGSGDKERGTTELSAEGVDQAALGG